MTTKDRDIEARRTGANRRQMLLGLGAAAGGAMALGARPSAAAERQVADAPTEAETVRRQPFYGEHQAGIVTPRPAHGMIAAFDVVVTSPRELEQLLRGLTERILFLTQGGTPPELDPKYPPADSGILGPVVQPNDLTITVALGASLFDNRPWLAHLKPNTLQRMVEFPNDALDPELCHGDLSLQFSAHDSDTNIHALRDILKTLSQFLVIRWKQEGSVPVIAPKPDGTSESARNFLGFRDGSANPNSNDAGLMDRIVWVDAEDGEPGWAAGGSYQAVRIIRNFVERWDRTPLREQEHIIGRRKMSGAPLDGGNSEHDVPDYAADPEGAKTPLDAHIRLANRRTPSSQRNLILRRPFNYSNGVTKNGQLDQGLLFIAYQADLQKGFIAVQSRLNGEPLEEYIKPVGGGFFFALPGVVSPGGYLGQSLVEAADKIPNEQS
ncbi:iron uptake transporter deferrochelatase/peroxidase subunit [Aurantimonas sp. MSK8Z-1]|uniref:iron uptake transporter deferrochelatase/peroxidase subunit n=1 Tax=Mangrovibrevibacter kandeliae TaxID=2968473 RepID=UPI0021196297|nr:iron uptake transporter deferrochelatase/peroxidase subunit [Aurantimonas sp. MSK8Z-1]MCW4116331.1 iron uptake transporter deferrochelatase/peroxidase subunit [Aurantimonas sp. MSK8Z-1]